MLLDGANEKIADADYPLSTDELVELCGECELDVPGETETVGEALRRGGPETFQTPEQVRLAVYAGVSGAAIGRKWYSDRDPEPPGSDPGREQLSF